MAKTFVENSTKNRYEIQEMKRGGGGGEISWHWLSTMIHLWNERIKQIVIHIYSKAPSVCHKSTCCRYYTALPARLLISNVENLLERSLLRASCPKCRGATVPYSPHNHQSDWAIEAFVPLSIPAEAQCLHLQNTPWRSYLTKLCLLCGPHRRNVQTVRWTGNTFPPKMLQELSTVVR